MQLLPHIPDPIAAMDAARRDTVHRSQTRPCPNIDQRECACNPSNEQSRTHGLMSRFSDRDVRPVMTDGFNWQGRRYKSLSAIARDITGTRWNGYRFFGLRDIKRGDAR